MSYDIGMEVDTGGRYPASVGEWFNYTYNVSPMYCAVFPGDDGIRGLHGMTGKDAAPILAQAIKEFRSRIKEMEELNPKNGWGDAGGALAFLESIIVEAERHPKAVVGVR